MWLNVWDSTGAASDYPFDRGSVLVGSDPQSQVHLGDPQVAAVHARLSYAPDGQVYVEDSGTAGGTWVDGVRVGAPTVLRPGQQVRIGRFALRLSAAPIASSPIPGQSQPTGPAALGQGQAAYGTGQPGVNPPAYRQGPFGYGQSQAPYASGWPGDGQSQPAYPVASTGVTAASGWGPPPAPIEAPTKRRRGRWLAGAGTLVVIAAVVALILTEIGGNGTYSAQKLAAMWGPSTLYVLVSADGQDQDSGSGWVLNAQQGLIVTNAHVVDGGTTFQVGQGKHQQSASLVGVSVCDDLAVLRVRHTAGLRSFNLATQSEVRAGESVTALGYPGNANNTPNLSVTTGVVSVTRTRFDVDSLDAPHYPDVIQTSAPINPGNSGGPLLDSRGRLIGINTAGITEDDNDEIIQGEGYAIGVDRARAVLAKLKVGNDAGFVGMDFTFPTEASDFEDFDLPVTQGGIIVASSDNGSPAARAGIGSKEPVVINAINGHRLNGTLSSYCNIVGTYHRGQSAEFHVVLPSGKSDNVTLPFE